MAKARRVAQSEVALPSSVLWQNVDPKAGQTADIGLGVFDPEQSRQIDKMGSDVKNLLGANVMSQMYIKAMQMGLDTFLMLEKFKFEVPMTILSYSQTIGQMAMGVFNKIKGDWEKAWTAMRDQNNQNNDKMLKSYRGE